MSHGLRSLIFTPDRVLPLNLENCECFLPFSLSKTPDFCSSSMTSCRSLAFERGVGGEN